MDTLFLVLILSTALVLGNEFSVAAFIHPSLARAGHLRFLPAIQIFASLFGKIMPFWMASTFVLHLVLLAATWRWPSLRSLLLCLAAAMWLVIIVFSLIGPVPIKKSQSLDGRQATGRLGATETAVGRNERNSGCHDCGGFYGFDRRV